MLLKSLADFLRIACTSRFFNLSYAVVSGFVTLSNFSRSTRTCSLNVQTLLERCVYGLNNVSSSFSISFSVLVSNLSSSAISELRLEMIDLLWMLLSACLENLLIFYANFEDDKFKVVLLLWSIFLLDRNLEPKVLLSTFYPVMSFCIRLFCLGDTEMLSIIALIYLSLMLSSYNFYSLSFC